MTCLCCSGSVSFQHGFRNQKFVITLLVEEFEDLTLALEEKKCTDLLFFDVSKAFDSINIELLLRKIENFGIGKLTIDWMRDFLTYRKFSVQFESYQSEFTTWGSPRGPHSVLICTTYMFLTY